MNKEHVALNIIIPVKLSAKSTDDVASNLSAAFAREDLFRRLSKLHSPR